jgi:putative tryptophan/tyrosine transport system substrate-binding protein
MSRLFQVLAVCAMVLFIASRSADAQQAGPVHRVGFLGPSAASATGPSLIDEFRIALESHGIVQGRNLVLDSRWPAGNQLDLLPQSTQQLLETKPHVIVAIGASAARVAAAATKETPIVFEIVLDPVAFGLVPSMERPGGNVTGLTTFDPQQARNQLQIMKEALPAVTHVALLGDDGAAPGLFVANENAARALGLEVKTFKVVRGPNPDFDKELQAAKAFGAGVVVVISTPVTTPNRKQIATLATKHGLPTLSPIDHVDGGGMLNYGTTFSESTRLAAGLVAKILAGAKPGDMPVVTVVKPELVINTKAARQLGLTLSPSALGKASRLVDQ